MKTFKEHRLYEDSVTDMILKQIIKAIEALDRYEPALDEGNTWSNRSGRPSVSMQEDKRGEWIGLDEVLALIKRIK